jgi:hypothetical protein
MREWITLVEHHISPFLLRNCFFTWVYFWMLTNITALGLAKAANSLTGALVSHFHE